LSPLILRVRRPIVRPRWSRIVTVTVLVLATPIVTVTRRRPLRRPDRRPMRGLR
jgi:hypothetical protein